MPHTSAPIKMFTSHRANSAGLWRLLVFFLVNICVHCNVPKPSAPAYYNQTILSHRNDSLIVDLFKNRSTSKKTFKGSLLIDRTADSSVDSNVDLAINSASNSVDSAVDSSPIEAAALIATPTLAAKPIDSARLAKPFLAEPKALIESSTSLSVLVQDVRSPGKAAEQASRDSNRASSRVSDRASSKVSSEFSKEISENSQVESLPKAQARVQQPQHTRSRTGSTTIDLSENKFGKPSIQYLNQSRPSTATYITKNNEVLTVRPVAKQANKDRSAITDLHIGVSSQLKNFSRSFPYVFCI